MPYCAACRVSYEDGTQKVYRVPRDRARRRQWEEALGCSFGDNSRICEQHFLPSHWTPRTQGSSAPKRRCLMPDAIPHPLPSEEEPEGDINQAGISCRNFSSQTDDETIQAAWVLENMRLKSEVQQLQQEKAHMHKELKRLRKLEATVSKIFTDSQLMKLKGGERRKNWTSMDISYGICFHTAGPRAYKHLYAKGFPLPGISTLQRWLRNVEITTGILDVAIDLMEHDVNIDADNRLCVLHIDKIQLAGSTDEGHGYVRVVIATGFTQTWKQPVYFDYNMEMETETLKQIVTKLFAAGYTVVAIVASATSVNYDMFSYLDVTETTPWFGHPSDNGLRIYIFFTVSNLVKQLRTHFLNTGLVIEGKLLQAATVEKVHEELSIANESSIHENHLNINCKKLKWAMGLFNRTTASDIRRCIDLGLIELENAEEIAELFVLIENWLNVFNTIDNPAGVAVKQPYGKALEEQQNVLTKMTNIMRVPLLPDSPEVEPFQNLILINNAALHELYEYLQQSYDIDSIPTKKLTPENYENFMNIMCRYGGRYSLPDRSQIVFRLRKSILSVHEMNIL